MQACAGHLLVVDDEPSNLTTLTFYLESDHYQVTCARSGREALEKLKDTEFDGVLLDIMMPGLSGYDVLQEVRQRFTEEELPVIMVTALSAADHVVQALEMGANDYVSKPINFRVLSARLNIQMKLREAQKARRDAQFALQERHACLESKFEDRTEALRDMEERFSLLAKHAPQVLYVATLPDRKCLYLSPAFEKIWNMPAGDVYADQNVYWNPIHPDDRERLNEAFALEDQGKATQTEYRLVHDDGSVIWIRDKAYPVLDENGDPYRIVGIAEDVTEQKMLFEKLVQSQKMEAIGKLAGGVAHDFNNLLTVINGYSKLLLRGLADKDSTGEILEEIHRAGERAQNLTRQLLAFSRKQTLQPKVLNLNDLVGNLQKMLKRLIGEDIELGANLNAKGLIEADPTQLEQIIMNLAINARDAMPTGGVLKLKTCDVPSDAVGSCASTTSSTCSFVRLSVTDSGCGMSPETIEHIFEPFYTTKGPGKGTGLGLATVYGIVTQSGGRIAVDSQVGQGTTFHIDLPRYCQAEDIKANDLLDNDIHWAGGFGGVLVVEDEEQVREFTANVLTEAGYTVWVAQSGMAALEIFEAHESEIRFVITDVVMPEMSGKELADILVQKNANLKILYVSGYTDDVIDNHGALEEGIPLLEKPFLPEELFDKLNGLMSLERNL